MLGFHPALEVEHRSLLAANTRGKRPQHLLLPPKSNLPFKCSDNQEKPQRPALPLLYPLHTVELTAVRSAPSEVAAVFAPEVKIHLTGKEKGKFSSLP